jgi:hypothetical protein
LVISGQFYSQKRNLGLSEKALEKKEVMSMFQITNQGIIGAAVLLLGAVLSLVIVNRDLFFKKGGSNRK